MHVNIGPYIDGIILDWQSNYLTKKYGYDDWPIEEDYTWFERTLGQVEDACQWVLSNTINKLRNSSKRDIHVRIDPYDTWSMDHTLAYIVIPMLEQLKATKHGAPFVDFEDRPEHLIPSKESQRKAEEDYSTDEFHFEAWDWVMDEMIFAFNSKLDEDWEEQFHTGVTDTIHIPLDQNHNPIGPGKRWDEEHDPEVKRRAKYYEMAKGPNDTHVFDREGHTKYQARITNGFKLFGKYYEGLWD